MAIYLARFESTADFALDCLQSRGSALGCFLYCPSMLLQNVADSEQRKVVPVPRCPKCKRCDDGANNYCMARESPGVSLHHHSSLNSQAEGDADGAKDQQARASQGEQRGQERENGEAAAASRSTGLD